MEQANIGVVGLAVMGQNLALNMADHGVRVVVHNRTAQVMEDFLAGPALGACIQGAASLAELTSKLTRPRKVLLMVKAGAVVDACIDQLLPHLEAGDIVIDGGNSLYTDTNRRTRELAEKGLLYVGAGISGGEEGARLGPSIMPGGNPAAWPQLSGIFQSVAAKVDGRPCCAWMGPEGAGHFVKMVHNGIEYGDMQLICETYDMLKRGLGLGAEQIQAAFETWKRGVLHSYLMDISAEILGFHEQGQPVPLVESIVDAAGQKGTGKWTVSAAQELGVPLTLIGEAVFARNLSALKDERVRAATLLRGPEARFQADAGIFVQQLQDALYAAKIASYAQGFMLLRAAAQEYQWELDFGAIALLWRGGCIIRSAFLNKIHAAFAANLGLENLLLDDFFRDAVYAAQVGWRKVVGTAVELGIPMPAHASALAFYDGYRSANLPANLLQAQRDYFGAHMYERLDRPRGEHFHTDWTGRGGKVASTAYSV